MRVSGRYLSTRGIEIFSGIARKDVASQQESKKILSDSFELDRSRGEVGALAPGQVIGEVPRLNLVGLGNACLAQPFGKSLERMADGELVVGRETALRSQIDQKLVDEVVQAIDLALSNFSRRLSCAEFKAGKAIVGFEVFLRSACDNLGRQLRRRRLFVPLYCLEVITHVLFVKAGRALLEHIRLGQKREESGEAFIDQHDFVVEDSELELRIRNDDSALSCIGASVFIKINRPVADLQCDIITEKSAALAPADILVMASVGLIAGVKIVSGSRSLCRSPLGSRYPQTVPLS